MSEPWQHYYQSQRLKLSYWTWGSASNPPLLMIHGGRDHARTWDRVANAFEDQWHVIAPDLRGHGDSEWVKGGHYGMVDHIPDLIALIDLFGGRVPVISHSFGGAISLVTAGVFPEKFERIVAIEGVGARLEAKPEVTPERLRQWTMKVRAVEQQQHRVYPSFREAAERMHEANKALTPEMADHLARWGSNAIDGGWVWKFDPWVRLTTAMELRADDIQGIWWNIDCPILHLVGTRSHVKREAFQEQPVQQYFKDARTIVVDDAGHWVHHDQLDVTVDAIREFLGAPPPPRVLE